MKALLKPVPGCSLEQRADLFLELARAARSGPNRSENLNPDRSSSVLNDRTGYILSIYQHLVDQGARGDEFADAVHRSAGMIAQKGLEQANRAVRSLKK